MIHKVVLIGILALIVAACQPRSEPLMATADYEQQVRKIAPPPDDRARLYIFTGKMGDTATLHSITGDIYIDETKIGTINPKEAMVVDVIPGKHSLHWHYMNQTGGPLLRSKRFETDFAGGTANVLFANVGWFDLEIAPGIVVTASNPGPANNVIPSLFKVVRPSSCPSTICMKP